MRITLTAVLVAIAATPLAAAGDPSKTAAAAGDSPNTAAAPASPPDVILNNIAVVRMEHDRLNRGDWQGAAALYAEDARNHGRPVGRAGIEKVLEDIYRTFPDWRMEIVDLVAAGDTVAVRCKVSGTHEGVGRIPVNGGMLVGAAPTHRHFEVQHIHWYTVRNGRIVEHYANRDDLDMMRQLGLLPPLEAAPPAPPK
jgi:predicted ester cyclase